MSQELTALWTGKGLDKLAAQLAGGSPVTIKTIAIGDGGGSMPSVQPSVSGLYGEKWRGNVNTVEVDPDSANSVIVEAVIPYNVGGWFIREWGLFDEGGELIAYGPHAEFYKPVLEDGTGAELLERIKLPISNQSQINLTFSSDVLATRKYVESEVDKLEAAQLQMDTWRKSMIGAVQAFALATLPQGWHAANGDLAKFEDWPELKEAYKSGKLEGMLLAHNASAADIFAYRKFRPNSADPTGLYLPDMRELFLRNSDTVLGFYNAPGLPELSGSFGCEWNEATNYPILWAGAGAFSTNQVHIGPVSSFRPVSSVMSENVRTAFFASKSNSIYGASNTVMPASVNLTFAIYLGVPTKV